MGPRGDGVILLQARLLVGLTRPQEVVGVARRRAELALAAALAALMAVGAYVHIPLPIVPVTLQTLFVYLAGLMLSPVYALMSQMSYLVLGLAGFPVFAGGKSGPAVVYSPTFGYLLSFPIAAWGMAALARRGPSGLSRKFFTCGIGATIILIGGAIYLWAAMRWILGTPLGFPRALWIGAVIFLPAEWLKITCAAWIAQRLEMVVRQ
jgi:biotin transport system substrate-specific component